MEVIFKAPIKIGNKSYKKTPSGKTEDVPVSLAYNNAFKKLVQSGAVQLVPMNEAKQKIRMSQDMKALSAAKAKRKATLQAKALKVSQTASPSPTPSKSSETVAEPKSSVTASFLKDE